METKNHTWKIGIYLFLAFIGFFGLMSLFGYAETTEFRFVNILFVIVFSYRLAQLNIQEDASIDAVNNLFSILGANLLAVSLSSISLLFYLSWITPSFLDAFSNEVFWGSDLTIHQAFIGIFIEGMFGALLVSFSVIQYVRLSKSVVRKLNW
jgi:hypothetical protein